jgi:hypothetical protein
MAIKAVIAAGANFAASALFTEFPPIPSFSQGWATFVGDGTLNSQDGNNLTGTGAFTNVGAAPTLHPNYGTFTPILNGWQTPVVDAPTFSILTVVRFNHAFSYMAGVWDASSNNTGLQFQAAGALVVAGLIGSAGCSLSGVSSTGWVCISFTKGPSGSYGVLTNLSAGGGSSQSTGVAASAHSTANWQIGSYQNAPSGYQFPTDIAFSMGVPAIITPAQQAQSYAALKGIMGARGLVLT